MVPAISINISTNITVTCSGLTAPRPKVSLNRTLKYLAKSGKLDEAIRVIESSPSDFSNSEVCALLLHACISARSLHHGQRLYSILQQNNHDENNLLGDPNLRSKFITLFSVCGQVNRARRIFDKALEDGHVLESLWVAMAIGYSRNGRFREALLVYIDMLCHFVDPGNFAFSVALKGCAHLKCLWVGKGVHAQIIKCSEKADQAVNNALLKFYTECGCVDEVGKMFAEMPQRNAVSWNSFMASLAERDLVFESLNVFRRMQDEGIRFTWVTLTTILPVCTRLTALHSGKEIHAQILKSKGKPDVALLNSLMDMYGKCGEVDSCRRVFNEMRSKDLTSWNTMLNGYALNGRMEEANKLFDEMVKSGMKPDGVTFIALLSGCSHAGLTDDGLRFFNRMKMDFGLLPNLEHYACVVDILGRAGRINEALELVETMPMKPTGSIWGSLLNSCRLHDNISLGEYVADKLFELEPSNAGNYVMLSNIYAKAGMWEDVNRIRDMMQSKGIKKEAGCSWIQIKTGIQTFVAGGSLEFRNSAEYKRIWSELKNAMEESGYVPNTGVVLHDVDEEMKTIWVCGHCERTATIFALVHTAAGMPIRIMKNLRVCADCHSWMKIISRITGRLIILRDTNRFHHFKGGACSCKDFW